MAIPIATAATRIPDNQAGFHAVAIATGRRASLCRRLQPSIALFPAKDPLASSRTSTMSHNTIRYATDPEYRAWKKAVARRWYEANEARAHAGALRRRYGLSLQDYDDLLARQNGGCGICRRKPKKKGKRKRRLCVDHDHRTRKIRGLLCINCNTGLGCFGDSPKFLRMAADYLDTWRRLYERDAPRIPKSSPGNSPKTKGRKGKT
jgi:Recombination endonuclease VII